MADSASYMNSLEGGVGNFMSIIRYAGKSDPGLVRPNNEDNWCTVPLTGANRSGRQGYLLAVADGLGGHAAGETASRIACETLVTSFRPEDGPYDPGGLPQQLETVIRRAHATILDHARENMEFRGMGTTISVLILLCGRLLIGHVGDSRIYRVRRGSIEQLTRDHTQVQHLLDTGQLTPEAASAHPMRHVLKQALGANDTLQEVYTRRDSIEAGDIFLLCTDGLHDMLGNREICDILLAAEEPDAACRHLISAALKAGGKDNVTALVARI